MYLSLGHLYDLKSPYSSFYIYMYASSGIMRMINWLILDGIALNTYS